MITPFRKKGVGLTGIKPGGLISPQPVPVLLVPLRYEETIVKKIMHFPFQMIDSVNSVCFPDNRSVYLSFLDFSC